MTLDCKSPEPVCFGEEETLGMLFVGKGCDTNRYTVSSFPLLNFVRLYVRLEFLEFKKVKCVTYPVFEWVDKRKVHKIWSESNKSDHEDSCMVV
jgi:hypothetical protein